MWHETQKTFMTESYFRNRLKVWILYSSGFWWIPERISHQHQRLCPFLQRITTMCNKDSSLQNKGGSSRSENKRTPANVGNIGQVLQQTLTTSMRHLAQQMELSYGTSRKDLALFPYRVTCVRELHEVDFPAKYG